MDNTMLEKITQIRKKEAEASLKHFARYYLPKHFKAKPCKAHEEVFRLLFDLLVNRGRKVVVVGPRNSAKSTIISFIYVLYCICFRKETYIVILSNTADLAREILGNIRNEIETNMRIRQDFPELTGRKPSPWTRDEIVTPTGIRVLVRGSQQSIRGRRHGEYRPTLVIADDLENKNVAFNYDTKEKNKIWYEQSVLEIGTKSTNHIMLGNLHHPDCLIGDYLDSEKNPDWIKLMYKAFVTWPENQTLWNEWSEIYNSRKEYKGQLGVQAALAYFKDQEAAMSRGAQILWPDYWNFYNLREKYENNPIAFNSEYQNEPLDPKTCMFQYDLYLRWNKEYKTREEFLLRMKDQFDFYCACDPSMGLDKERGDFTAIVIIARHRESGKLYLILTHIERMSPDQAIEYILAYYGQFTFANFAIETNQFQALMAREFTRRCEQRNIYMPVEYLRNSTNKKIRIQSLEPLMRSGTLILNDFDPLFNEQLRTYPKCKYDDALDALEMAVRIAEDRTIKVWYPGMTNARGGEPAGEYTCWRGRIDGPI